MMRLPFGRILGVTVVACLATFAAAQSVQPMAPVPGADAAQPPTTQPAVGETPATADVPAGAAPFFAEVIDLRGDAQWAPLGSDDYQPVKQGDRYPQETVIVTGLRSSVKLRLGDDDTYTAVLVEPASKTLLAELYTANQTKRVRIGVGFGQVRGGVVEGALKSDFTVGSPVATLSKRGTWDFGLFYEQGSDRFQIFLHEEGLVSAFKRSTGQRRSVLPGELVNQTMRRWLDESQIRRNVAIADFLGQSDIEVAFNRLRNDGLRILSPEGGQAVLLNLGPGAARQEFANVVRQQLAEQQIVTPRRTPTLVREEGFFGTGGGQQLIPLIIGSDSSLVQRGIAQPGTYRFPRPVLEGWLKQQGH